MQRWSDDETLALSTMRDLLKDVIASVDQNVEVVGDRALLRFYRGHLGNMDTACRYYTNYLNWRKENNIDSIRNEIVNGTNTPKKFPKGEFLTTEIPQTFCDVNARCNKGCPISILRTTFSPSLVFEGVNKEEYVQFIQYSLEFQQLILEQLAEQEEREILKAAQENGQTLTEPYGIIKQGCSIRDMYGLSLEHIGTQGQDIIRTIIAIAQDNYPELLNKVYIVNTPWIFNAFWWALKVILPARTQAKVFIQSTGYQTDLHKEIHPNNLPDFLGGAYEGDPHLPFEFDTSDGGLLHCPQEMRMK